MTQKGDNSTVSGKVQSTSMESLNDELTPETDKPQQEIKENKEESMPTKIIHRLGSFITKSSKLENQLEKMAEMECEIKAKSDVIEFLNKKLDDETDDLIKKLEASTDEIDRYKEESEATTSRMTQMENELKSKTREIQYLQKMEGEWKSRISQLENEVNAANCKINSKMAEDVQRILETVEDNSSYLRANDSRQTECESEKNSLIRKMEDAAKLKDQEMENLKIAHAKTETEWKCAKVHLEREIRSKDKKIDNLERKSKHEFDDLNKKLEASREEIDRCKRESDKKIADMENDNKLKTNEIEYLQKSERELKIRISQLEDEVKAANCKIGENLKMSGDVQRTLEIVETNSRDYFEKVEKNLRSLLDKTSGKTIRARFTNISSLTSAGEDSKGIEFAGMNWRIHVYKINDHLRIRLSRETTTRWSATVFAEFKLMSQNGDRCVKSVDETYNMLIGLDWALGKYDFMSFEDLLKSDAVRDNSINVEVVFRAFPDN